MHTPRGHQKQIHHGANEDEILGPLEHGPPGADRSPGHTVAVTVTGVCSCRVSSAETLGAQPLSHRLAGWLWSGHGHFRGLPEMNLGQRHLNSGLTYTDKCIWDMG